MKSALSIIGAESEACSSGAAFNVTADGDRLQALTYRGNAAVVTLGCAKNQVDSEVMLGVLRNQGYQVVSDLAQAEVVIVNTCGFLESSVKESIDCVLDVSELRNTGRLRRLIVAGCMPQRYNGDLQTTLPEVDAFIGVNDVLKVGEAAAGVEFESALQDAARPYFLYDENMPRQLSTAGHFAYVKVSEGCDRPCTFCIIPKIRGPMRSRSVRSVVEEVKALAASGVKEVNLVAQDLTAYGKDRRDTENLGTLLRALDSEGGVPWVRLLYAYPIGVTSELLSDIVALPSICDYLDIPLQHSSEAVLKRMQRPIGRYSPRSIVEFIRTTAPAINIRTTFIVGFPGETDEDIADLEDFISAGHFTNLGIFTYSREEGTPSYDMDGQIPEREKIKRRNHLMKTQQTVVKRKLQELVGTELEVLLEGAHEESDLLLKGRTRFQAPEVDGVVIINDFADNAAAAAAGQLRRVEISECAGYDLIGTLK